MSDSDESLPLHDTNWEEDDLLFSYVDPHAFPPQIIAVIQNDTEALKALLQAGRSVNNNDNQGHTPLHVAVIKSKTDAFLFLLSVPDIRLDVQDYDGNTPLIMALVCRNYPFATALINAGADLSVRNNALCSVLHLSAQRSLDISRLLIKKGADINAQDENNETPLHMACQSAMCDIIHMLLFYDADPTIGDAPPFVVAVANSLIDVQEVLFDLTYPPECADATLHLFNVAMVTSSPLFPRMLATFRNVTYTDQELEELSQSLPQMNLRYFRLFMEKFDNVVLEMFAKCETFHQLLREMSYSIREHAKYTDLLMMLFGSDLIGPIMDTVAQSSALIYQTINQNTTLETLTGLICCLLSHGINLYSMDLNLVYRYHGHCDLFKIMLHLEIMDEERIYEPYLMPILIYDLNLDMDACLLDPKAFLHVISFESLLGFYAQPRFKAFCLREFADSDLVDRVKLLPEVPSLRQLARDQTRRHIVKTFGFRKTRDFYTYLRWLPIANAYKEIIAFERRLYRV